MKVSSNTPKKNDQAERRFKPIRLVIICVVIALLLVSTSVGMSYARFKSIAGTPQNLYFSENNFVHGKNVVVAYINKNDSAADTVLSYDQGRIIVTVPRGLSAEENCIAYALAVSEYRSASYDVMKGAYTLSAKMRLYGLGVSSDDSLSTYDVASENNQFITLKMLTEATMNTAESNQSAWNVSADSGVVTFGEVSNIGTKDTDVDVNVAYNKTNWNESTDITWYNETSTEFDINSATQLAGLAKLVNEGKDFSGVTINLSEDIDLYGTGGEGDVREWTPIGTADHPFKGNFNGNNHTVSGLTLSGGINAENVGLFGVVEGNQDSYIKDFTLDKPLVYGKENKNTGTVIGKATGYQLTGIKLNDLMISGADQAVVGTLVGQANGAFGQSGNNVHAYTDEYGFVGEDNTTAPTEAPVQEPTEQ